MSTKAGYRGGVLGFRDGNETVMPLAAVRREWEFMGPGAAVIPVAGSAESGVDWVAKIVGAAPPTVAAVANAASGVIACTLTATSEKQEATLYAGDVRNLALLQGLVIEFVAKASVLPTGNSELVLGVLGDWIDGPDNATYSAFFTMDGSGEVFCEVDDNATDQSATSGVTVLATEWHTYRIEFSATDIRFYIDNNQVASATTFVYAATGANAVLQPYVSGYKASGTGVGTILTDAARVWQNRS